MQKHTITKTFDNVLYSYDTSFEEKIRDYGNEKCFIRVIISCVKTVYGWNSALMVDYHWDDDDGDVYFRDSFYAHEYTGIGDLMDQILDYVDKHSLGEVLLGSGEIWFDVERGKDKSNIGFSGMHDDVIEAIIGFLQKEVSKLEKNSGMSTWL